MVLEQTRPGENTFKAAKDSPRETAGAGMGASKKSNVSENKNPNAIFLAIIALLAITTLFLFVAKNNIAAKNMELQSQLDTAVDAKATAEKQLAETTAIKDELQGRVEQMKKEALGFAAQVEQEKRLKENALAQLNEKLQEAENLKKSVEAERQEKLALKETLGKENEDLKAQLNEVRTTKESLEKKLKQTLARKGIKLEKIVVRPETGELVSEGQVLVVNKEFDFVVVNLGENDGLKVGSKLQVLKDDQPLGTIEVEKIYGNMSAATLLPDAQKDKIKEGCSVRPI